jgi:hypothetical protein
VSNKWQEGYFMLGESEAAGKPTWQINELLVWENAHPSSKYTCTIIWRCAHTLFEYYTYGIHQWRIGYTSTCRLFACCAINFVNLRINVKIVHYGVRIGSLVFFSPEMWGEIKITLIGFDERNQARCRAVKGGTYQRVLFERKKMSFFFLLNRNWLLKDPV